MKYLLGLLLLTTPALANTHADLAKAAAKAGIELRLLKALCMVESNLNPKAVHKDDGASDSIGLCQLKLETAKLVGYRGKAAGLLVGHINAYYAALYLRRQIVRYQNVVKGISAYNMGSAKVLKNGTLRNAKYVRKVLRAYSELA
jgi:soluble lytic murein transglycosylase-like protein